MTGSVDLIDAQDSVLIVVDAQDYFFSKLDPAIGARVVQRIRWLVRVATWFGMPVIVTAEDISKNGPTSSAIREVLPERFVEHDKLVFGLAGQSDILGAVRATGRNTCVLVGLETDVCIQHSALGLAALGYRVAVVVDATASPETGHLLGLARMRAAGIIEVSSKSIFYEWLRDLDAMYRFRRESGVEAPGDLLL